MTVLTQVAGLPISLNSDLGDLYYDTQDVECTGCGTVNLTDISPSLLNKALMYPEKVYKHHKELRLKTHCDNWAGKLCYDAIYLPDGLLGIEYIKTHIFYSNGEGVASVVQVFTGMLTVMLQKNRPKESAYDFDTHVEEAVIVEVGAGQKMAIPANYYYTFVNAGNEPVVFGRIVSKEHIADYNALRRESGLAYYLISKNARQELVHNPRYRTVPQVKWLKADQFNKRISYKANQEVPLYEEAVSPSPELAAMMGI